MSDLKDLRCFNPRTGKRDGGWCVWEGGGKCMKCEAADRIENLEHNLKVEMESRDRFWKQVIEQDVIINSLKKRLNDGP